MYLVTSTPEKTISAYIDAIKRRDAPTAYDQLSSRLKSQTNEQQFTSAVDLVGIFIGDYSINNVQVNGSTATAIVTFTAVFFVKVTYTVALVKENDVWKLDGGTLVNSSIK